MSRLSTEMKLIPKGAWACGVVLCFVFPLLLLSYLLMFMSPPEDNFRGKFDFLVLMGAFASIAFFIYILLLGYIFADARRRGMQPILWLLLAIFVPSTIGIILYFILRKPLLQGCPKCGKNSDSLFAFCPSCGASIARSCPGCQCSVQPNWTHCARCGVALP